MKRDEMKKRDCREITRKFNQKAELNTQTQTLQSNWLTLADIRLNRFLYIIFYRSTGNRKKKKKL